MGDVIEFKICGKSFSFLYEKKYNYFNESRYTYDSV